jgi:steroid delta-isomerase-like uncharacterized protein
LYQDIKKLKRGENEMQNHSLTTRLPLLKTLSLIAILLIFGLLVICKLQVANAESGGDVKSLVKSSLEVWNKGNMALVDELYTPNFKLHLVNQVNGDREGTEAFKEYVNFLRTAYPDMKIESDELIVSDDKVIMLGNFTGQNKGPRGDVPPTGKNVEVSVVTISRIDDGKIAETWFYVNMASVFRQLGFTITPPSAEE